MARVSGHLEFDSGAQARNLQLEALAATPAPLTAGRVWWDSVASRVRYADGSAARTLGADQGLLYPEDYGATGGVATHDDWAGLQNAFDLSASTGRAVWLYPGQTYYLSKTLVYDPSRSTVYGNSANLNWGLKTFTDPATMPELVTNPSFDSGQTGWTVSPFSDNTSLAFTGGNASATGQPSGANSARFSEFGQRITVAAGKFVRITLTVGSLDAYTVGFNTYTTFYLSLRDNGVGDGGYGESLRFPSRGNIEYTSVTSGDRVWEFDIPSPFTNPYLTIGSNSGFVIRSLSVKELPDNACLLVRAPSAGVPFGHTQHGIDRIRIAGATGGSPHADGVVLDTADPNQSSRFTFTNSHIEGVGRGMVFQNRAYLINIIGTRVFGATTCFDTLAGSVNAGENITVVGGYCDDGAIGIRNRGGFGFRFISHSIDFVKQFYVGTGMVEFVTCWFESRQFTAADAAASDFANTQFRFDVWGSDVKIHGGFIQINGDPGTNTYPTHFFRIGAFGRLALLNVTTYNLMGSSGELSTGAGMFDIQGMRFGGYFATPEIINASTRHNAVGAAGGFETSTVDLPAYVSSSAPGATRVSRHQVDFANLVGVSSTVTRGSRTVTMASTTGLFAGYFVDDPGFPAGTTIATVDSGTQITTTQAYNSASGTVSVTYRNQTPFGSLTMAPSADFARTGSQSLKIFKSGVGSGTDTGAHLFFPVKPRAAVGCRFWYRVPPLGSGSTQIYFQSYLVRLVDADVSGVNPRIVEAAFSSDNPVTIDMATGVGWTRSTLSTMRQEQFVAHDGYTPDWATHFYIGINLVNAASGFRMYIDDLHGNSF